jgi:hypothetical protein
MNAKLSCGVSSVSINEQKLARDVIGWGGAGEVTRTVPEHGHTPIPAGNVIRTEREL